ncbi:MAG TPA: GNAT family N-acetyltransferase [Ferrovibrio sp.]|jgi:GNAT superfamily N-acetyltransferase|uniref:GNAT family N-acetyltransferase n=1 Tax=Ferrovibrio sp. TaxID=1917215 RepID=UPI002ED39411
MTLTIRKATRADVPAIIRMLADDILGAKREAYADPLPQAYYDAFETIARSEMTEQIVAEQDGRIVGSMQLTYIPGLSRQGMSRAVIEAVRIDTPLRGKGLGSVMIRWAIARAREKGCGVIQLTSDKARLDAHRFYERLGFKASHIGMKMDLR